MSQDININCPFNSRTECYLPRGEYENCVCIGDYDETTECVEIDMSRCDVPQQTEDWFENNFRKFIQNYVCHAPSSNMSYINIVERQRD